MQLGFISCTFRQTNIIWVLYAYASSQLTYLRFRRALPGAEEPRRLHDPPALAAGPRSSPISVFLRDGRSRCLMVFSGSCSISIQPATDVTRHLSGPGSIRTVTRLVCRFCDLERWGCAWYVQCRTFLDCALAVLPYFSRGQVKSRALAPHSTVVLLCRVCDDNGLACSGQWGWGMENVKG